MQKILLMRFCKTINLCELPGNNLDAETNARELLDFWRQNNLPIFHIQHCSTHPKSKFVEGKISNEFQDIIMPNVGEQIIKKNVHSAFIGTDLKQQLDKSNIKNSFIIASNQCKKKSWKGGDVLTENQTAFLCPFSYNCFIICNRI